jgi:nucleotide-binding universal stress UspA family protein
VVLDGPDRDATPCFEGGEILPVGIVTLYPRIVGAIHTFSLPRGDDGAGRGGTLTARATPRVLIAYDGSPSASTAVRAAASLFPTAQAYVATVPQEIAVPAETVLPGLPTTSPDAVQRAIDELVAEAQRQAGEAAQQAVDRARALGLQAEVVPVGPSGPAWETLLDAAHRVDADVLACGTRGRGAFARALLGSTSSRLLHHTDVPLLVVPDGGGALDGPAVAAYDGSQGATHAIQVVGRLLSGRATVVVHAWEPAFHRSLAAGSLAAGPIDDPHGIVADLHEALADSASSTTEAGVAAARAAGLDAVGDAVESAGGAWRAVATAARMHGASVIATGTRGLGAARSALLGSFSSGLIHNAELPILVVPDEPAAAPAHQDG